MNLSEKFSQEQLKELLEDVYKKVNQSEFMSTREVLEDIQNKILNLTDSSEQNLEL